MNTAPETAPNHNLEDRINIALSRIKGIRFFEYIEPVNPTWLEGQANILMNTLDLPNLPLKIFTDVEEANKFAAQVDYNNDWVEKWETIRNEALRASGAYNNLDMKLPWHYSRRKALDATEKLQEIGYMGRDAGKRCASWVQWVTVEDKLKKPNPLTPFIVVNEKGADLIGPAHGEFGVFIPSPLG